MSKRKKQEIFFGILFALPVIFGFIIFVFMPLIVSLVVSLTDYTIAMDEINFVGLSNYINLFNGNDIYFLNSLLVTCYYVLLSVPLQIVFSFFVALTLSADIKGRSFFRTIFYLPTIVPAVASSILWMMLFDPDTGIFNAILDKLGLPTSLWIYGENTVIPSLAIMSLWTIGGTVVIFLAGIQNVPKELYEAVKVDGGNTLVRLRNITLPMVSPTIFFNLIMSFIGSFQVFSQAYIMTNGGPNNKSMFYVFYMYREAFTYGHLGVASALGWILFIIILLLTMIVFRSSSVWVFYEGEVKNN
ncbi:MAG: carbohydrate ABC transporter permease [Lachnospirales bacterium]